MFFFNLSPKTIVWIIISLLIPLFLFTMDRQSTENSLLFRSLFYVTTQTQVMYKNLTSGIENTVNTYLNLIKIKKQSDQLIKENKHLRSQLNLFTEIQQENSRLRQLIQFSKKENFPLISAQVVGRSSLSSYHLVTLNRGSQHGVKKRMMVINELGFVGYIFRIKNTFSQVILLTAPNATTHVVLQSSRIHGILEGTGKDHCLLKYLKRRDNVNIGDTVVTTLFDNHTSVKGFPVGTVSAVKKQPYGLTQTVIVKPFINFSQLEEVFIVQTTNFFQDNTDATHF